MDIFFYWLKNLFMTLLSNIRRIPNHNIKSTPSILTAKHIAEPCMPKKELIILCKVYTFQFFKDCTIHKTNFQLPVYSFRYFTLQLDFSVMVET